MLKHKIHKYGFTIIELLVVIVVIGILATIVVVSYNGIQKQAIASSCQSDVTNAKKKIELYYVEQGSYPYIMSKAGVVDSKVCTLSYYINYINGGYAIIGEKNSIKIIATNNSEAKNISSSPITVDAQGGVITTDDGDYRVHKFTSNGTFKVTSASDIIVELLVVAGGGGGGSSVSGGSGGGGGGGLIHYDNYLIPANNNIDITVGIGGGPGLPKPNPGSNGTNSKFGPIEAIGGGGGGAGGNALAELRNGRDGGSGGGAGFNGYCQNGMTPRIGGKYETDQGNKGGSTSVCGANSFGAAGGGGAGGEGNVNTLGSTYSAGGSGKNFTISGSKVEYSAGGLTGSSYTPKKVSDSPDNSGKGGDAAYPTDLSVSSKAGGSGVVIIRYKK